CETCRSSDCASRFVLARFAKRDWRVAATTETRIRKRHRTLQRAFATRSAFQGWQQRTACSSAWIKIDQAIFERKRRIGWAESEDVDSAERIDSKIANGSRRFGENF